MTDASQPDFSLADVQSGIVNEAILRDYSRDLGNCADVLNIQIRSRDRSQIESIGSDVESTVQQILNARIGAVQIRYRFESNIWIDTIMRVGDEFRLIRVQSDNLPHEILETDR